jgi:protein-tyrosine phosphatase
MTSSAHGWRATSEARVIDLHSHVLPGIDDGPLDLAGSIALAAEAARQGVTVLAATPHARDDFPDVDLERVPAMCADLQGALPAEARIEIVTGAEVDVLWAQQASEEELRLASFARRGTDLLVETPYGQLPPNFEDMLFMITVRGFRILLAHPERNPTFQADRARLAALVHRGVLVQITAPSLLEESHSPTRRYALELVEDGLAHVLSSDAHAVAGFRPPTLAEAFAVVARIDRRRAEWMVVDAPAAILAGIPLPPRPPLPGRRLAARLNRRLPRLRGR